MKNVRESPRAAPHVRFRNRPGDPTFRMIFAENPSPNLQRPTEPSVPTNQARTNETRADRDRDRDVSPSPSSSPPRPLPRPVAETLTHLRPRHRRRPREGGRERLTHRRPPDGEEKEARRQGLLLLLRPRVRRREDPRPAPEGQALQVPRLPQEALHRLGHGHTRPPGPQGVRDQVRTASPSPLFCSFPSSICARLDPARLIR